MMHGVQKVNIDLRLRQEHAPIFPCAAKLKGLVKPIRACSIVQIPYAEAIRTAQTRKKPKETMFLRKGTGVPNKSLM